MKCQPELKLSPEVVEIKRRYLFLYFLEDTGNIENNREELREQRKIFLEMTDEKEWAEKAKVDFAATYAYGCQRQFLNNSPCPPSVDDIKEISPIFLFKDNRHNEFLAGLSIHRLNKRLTENAERILAYGHAKIYQITTFAAMQKFLSLIWKI